MVKMFVNLSLYVPDNSVGGVHGLIDNKPLDASDDADNEENAVRLAEQMVREAFRRLREKKAKADAK